MKLFWNLWCFLFYFGNTECTKYWIKCCIYVNIRFPPLCFISGDELEKIFLLYVAYCIELCHSNPLQEQWSLSLYIVSFHVLYSEVLKIMIWEFKVHHCWRKFWCTKPVQVHFVGQNSHSQSFMSLLSALKSKNTVVPFTISVFLQLCVCVMLLRSLMEVHIFDTAHPTQFE